jgi:hypothetical protein
VPARRPPATESGVMGYASFFDPNVIHISMDMADDEAEVAAILAHEGMHCDKYGMSTSAAGYQSITNWVWWPAWMFTDTDPELERSAWWLGSPKRECLNHFFCFSLGHLDNIVAAYVSYFNTARPHQGLGNVPIPERRKARVASEDPEPLGKIGCQEWLGGVLKHYYRKAA